MGYNKHFIDTRLTLRQFINFVDYNLTGGTTLRFVDGNDEITSECETNSPLLEANYDKIIESVDADGESVFKIWLLDEDEITSNTSRKALPKEYEDYDKAIEQVNKITELLMTGKDDSVVVMDIIKLLDLEIDYREPFIPYGKVIDLEDGNELWSEPVTDTRDGLVLRNQYGSIIATYLQ